MIEIENYLATDQVNSLPLREALVVDRCTVLRGAIARMRSHELGCAVIADHALQPLGIFTERSVLNALMQNACLDDRTVGDFLDPGFLSVSRSELISTVWDAIHRDGVRFVCVTDDEGKVIGITGQRGVAEYVSEFFPQQLLVHRLGSKPWMQQREGA